MNAEKDRKKRRRRSHRPPSKPKIIVFMQELLVFHENTIFAKSTETWTNKSPKGSQNGAKMVPTSTKRAIEKHIEKSMRKKSTKTPQKAQRGSMREIETTILDAGEGSPLIVG